jgi:CheY-like chemotaxis protein
MCNLEMPMAHKIEHQPSLKLVLLVEDDVDIGEVLLEIITQETPYQAVLKTDGQEALAAVQSQKPDLFILDYHLPHMTGIELYDKLHAIEELALVPALMISARLPLQELRKRNITGMNKPIDLDDFIQTIDRFLE